MALINGKVYDWNSVTINVSGMENIELQEISYDDEPVSYTHLTLPTT